MRRLAPFCTHGKEGDDRCIRAADKEDPDEPANPISNDGQKEIPRSDKYQTSNNVLQERMSVPGRLCKIPASGGLECCGLTRGRSR